MVDFEVQKAKVRSAKKRLMDLWDSKGLTDHEILKAAAEVDRLLNEYCQIKTTNSNRGNNKKQEYNSELPPEV